MSTKITDDEMRVAARALLLDGKLTFRALRAHLGGGESGRLSQIMREVRTEQEAANGHGLDRQEEADATLDDIPAALRGDLNRLERSIQTTLGNARREERDHATQRERLLAARHLSELGAERLAREALEAQLTDLEDAAMEQAREIEDASSALMEAKVALAAADEERRRQTEAHAEDRQGLTLILQAAQNEAAQLRAECRTAERLAAEARKESLQLNAELASVRAELQVVLTTTATAEQRVAELEDNLTATVGRMSLMEAEVEGARTRVRQLELELASTSARLETSAGIVEKFTAALGDVPGGPPKRSGKRRDPKSTT
jgi:chromosome segregation ATPase